MKIGWTTLYQQAISESGAGHDAQAMQLLRRALTHNDIPDTDRGRMAAERDLAAARLLVLSAAFVPELTDRPAPRVDSEVTVTLSAGSGVGATEQTLNSFLSCCTDSGRVGRILLIDAGLSLMDRVKLAENYPFLEFLTVPPEFDLNIVREQVESPYWLHLWHGWRFFTQEALVTRLIEVLNAEPGVYQVGINPGDALGLSRNSPVRSGVRITPRGSRYVLSDVATTGPAMFDMSRLSEVIRDAVSGEFRGHSATLDEVLCIHNSQLA